MENNFYIEHGKNFLARVEESFENEEDEFFHKIPKVSFLYYV